MESFFPSPALETKESQGEQTGENQTVQEKTAKVHKNIVICPSKMSYFVKALGSRNPIKQKRREPFWRDKALHGVCRRQIGVLDNKKSYQWPKKV